MNFKDTLLLVCLALLISLGFNYYFGSFNKPTEENVSGTTEVAPRVAYDVRPVNTEIDFLDDSLNGPERATVVQTQYAQLTFSNHGACITDIQYRHCPATLQPFKTDSTAREHRLFLVAFDRQTPYIYTLSSAHDAQEHARITYQYQLSAETKIVKTFVVDKKTCRVDMTIALEGAPLVQSTHLRVVLPSPHLDSISNDTVRVVANKQDEITLYSNLKEASTLLWRVPTLFGLDDRYFLFAMVSDNDHAIDRAFLHVDGVQQATAMLETKEIAQPTAIELGFYVGPKRSALIEQVDNRLSAVMDYSYWAPIAKPLLWLLNYINDFVHSYGLAIILLTLLMKLAMLPFSLHGQQSMEKNAEFHRKMKLLEQKYAGDKERLAQEQQELMRKHGVGGMFGGCLPMFANILLFFALGKVLNTAIELHCSSFLWVPDLAQKDPYYILPIISAAAIAITVAPMLAGKQSLGAKHIIPAMAIMLILSAFTAALPAALMLFMIMSALLGVVQTKLLKKYVKV